MVADDHPVVLAGVCSIIEASPDMEVAARVSSGNEVVPTAVSAKPDVVVLDLFMPGLAPVDAVRAICAALPTCRILVLSGWASRQDQDVILRAGAHGYISKDADVAMLPEKIRALFPDHKVEPQDEPVSLLQRLSAREQEICAQVARGLSNREVAEAIGIGEETVRRHVTKILGKLGLARRTQLALIAVREGFGSLDDVPSTPSRRRRPQGPQGSSTPPPPTA